MHTFASGVNTMTVEVIENTTIPNAEYLFIYVHDLSNKKVACTSSEITVDGIRSQFEITLTSSPDPLQGEVEFEYFGFYHYYIYQKTSAEIAAFDYANVDSLDLRTLTGLVDNGKVNYPTTYSNTAYKDYSGSVKIYGS